MSQWPYKMKVESRTADRRVTGDEGHAMVKALRAELASLRERCEELEREVQFFLAQSKRRANGEMK